MAISLKDVSLAGLIGGAAFSVIGAYQSSKAKKNAYATQSAVDANNAQYAELQAQDAIERGNNTADNVRIRGAQLKSTQRATMAARGIALDEGSPLNILNDTEYMTEHDALTAKDNAAKEAWALRIQGKNYNANASLLADRADAENPFMNAAGSLLTSGGTVADRWYGYNKTVNTNA